MVRRHRLAERLLVDVIGLEWEKVHREANLWEHVISADVEEKLVELLGDPATCPHGNPHSRLAVTGWTRDRHGLRSPMRTPAPSWVARVGGRLELDEIRHSVFLATSNIIPGQSAVVVAHRAEGGDGVDRHR